MNEKIIRIAICDDELITRTSISKKLQGFHKNFPNPLSFTEFSSGEELLKTHIDDQKFHIIFLDMLMPGLNGIETARHIRKIDKECIIIFITSSIDYAVQSYRVDAFDYILKGGDDESLERIYLKAILSVIKKEDTRLVIKSKTSIHFVLCNNIEYIEIYGKKLTYHLVSSVVLDSYKPLHELEKELQPLPQFYKTHRSIIVNMMFVVELNPHYVRTVHSLQLPISRGKYKDFEQNFLKFSGYV